MRRAEALSVKNDGGEDGEESDDGGEADAGCGAAAEGALFAAGVEQHDDEDEQHHDRAGVDDDLGDGEKLRAEQQVEDGQRGHDHDQRKGAVNGMGLHQEIDGSREAESGKKEEQDQMHRGSRTNPSRL